MRDYRKLRAFELADDLAVWIYRATTGFPREEIYGLTAQMRRAAVSIPSNIVEGCARDSQPDFLPFLFMSFGSLKELRYQVDLSHRLGFLSSQNLSVLEPKLSEAEKVVNGLIRAVRNDC